MQVANFGTKHGGEWAPPRRNLGSLFVRPKEKSCGRGGNLVQYFNVSPVASARPTSRRSSSACRRRARINTAVLPFETYTISYEFLFNTRARKSYGSERTARPLLCARAFPCSDRLMGTGPGGNSRNGPADRRPRAPRRHKLAPNEHRASPRPGLSAVSAPTSQLKKQRFARFVCYILRLVGEQLTLQRSSVTRKDCRWGS
jgi:hypothetical protein